MKKTLVALAAMAATGAFAQATLYGSIDVCYISHSTEATAGTVSQKSSGIGESCFAGPRLGVKGEEDLGGGLKASYTIEWGYSVISPYGNKIRVGSSDHQTTTGGGSGMSLGTNRQSWAAVSGGFGEAKAGYFYTNAYELLVTISGMGGETQGSNHLDTSPATRYGGLKYTAPTMGGVTVKLDYATTSGKNTLETTSTGMSDGYKVNNSSVMSLSAVYNAGPLMAGYVHTRNAIAQTVASAAGVNAFGGAVAAATTALNGSATYSHLVATYDLGVAKLGYMNGRSTAAGTLTNGGISTNNNTMALNVPLGQATLQLVTGRTTTSDNSTDKRSTLVGAKYALSKRTTVYVLSGTDENAGTAAAALDKDNRTMVGINHTF